MSQPIVEISDGKLKGTIRENYKKEKIYAFLGIPYAEPPVGDLRFKAPLPVKPWQGVKEAIQDSDCCAQADLISSTISDSEDCLYLNVFTKDISGKHQLKPVLVYIHGGAFQMGSSNSKIVSPGFLMMEDMVLVTINYRLGVLGFLKLNDPSLGVPGNAGMKDQVLALKWVQKNINKFGGDPNNVTIFGGSAGSASVNYLLLSPSTKGLFNKAIMQSGSVLNPWARIRPDTLEIMKYIKSDCKNEAEILETLMKTSVTDLIEAQTKYKDQFKNGNLRNFAPCVEQPNDTAFLTREPIDIISSGDYHKVPMIIGYNYAEGLAFMRLVNEGKDDSEISYESYIPEQMNTDSKSELGKMICEKLRNAYPNHKKGSLAMLLGDYYFVAGITGLAKHFARSCPSPVFLYQLTLCTPRNLIKKLFQIKEPGATHGDDLGYCFDTNMDPNNPNVHLPPESPEEKAVHRYMRLWGNFLKYGNPTPRQEEFGMTWQPVTSNELKCMEFSEELNMKTNADEERMKLWRDIYNMHPKTKNLIP